MEAQAALPPQERLRLAGAPEAPPPSDLPLSLQSFAHAWRGLRLTGALGIEELLAELAFPVRRDFAAPLLHAKQGWLLAVAALLREEDRARRDLARRAVTPPFASEPSLLAPLEERLRREETAPDEVRGIACALEEAGAAARPLVPLLLAWAERLRQREYYTARQLTEIAGRLERLTG